MVGGAGGGGGLNFKVAQYTATPTASAAENTIGVVTDTAITGWVMQAEQPTASAGLVWIEVGAESEVSFFADKKELVKVYPVSVKQYVDSAWTSVEAYIYLNNAWTQFSAVGIYRDGVFGVPHTYSLTNATYVENDDSVVLTSSGGSMKFEMYVVLGPVNLSNVDTISMKSTARDASGGTGKVYAVLFVSPNTGATYSNNTKISSVENNGTTDVGLTANLLLNVADLSGNYYIYCGSHSNGSTPSKAREFTLTEVL